MELSTRDAKAATAVARGERVIVTKHGRPFIEPVPAREAAGMDFEKAALVRQELGLDGLQVELPPDLGEPGCSRRVLGPPD